MWLMTSQACSRWILKWAKDSEPSRKSNPGVSIKFKVGSWLKENNRLCEQGTVRPINLGGSGGMLPIKFWNLEALKCHFQHSGHQIIGNCSVCMAIRCEIKVQKNHSSIAILGTEQTTRYWTKHEGCICTRKHPVTFLIFHPFVSFLFLRTNSSREKTYKDCLQTRQTSGRNHEKIN